MEQLISFIEKAQSDKELMAKLDVLGEKDAGTDEIIALAKENGFTITADEIEKLKSENTADSAELKEDELETVAGGGSQNRYDPKSCKNMYRTKYNCVGFLSACWCDHYRKECILDPKKGKYSMTKRYWHSCTMNAFSKYKGDSDGRPD